MTLDVLDALQKRFGSANFSRYQIIRQPYYDTVRVQTAGTTQMAFFTVPIGGTDPVGNSQKTLEQTNLVKSGSLGQIFFVLTQIRCYVGLVPKARQVSGTISGDANGTFHGWSSQDPGYQQRYNELLNRGVLNISFAQKSYYQIEAPFVNAGPGFGVQVHAFGASKVAGDVVKKSIWVQQDNSFTNVWNLSPIQIIEPELQMGVTIDFPDGVSPVFTNTYLSQAAAQATPTMEAMVMFDGYSIRPQQ